MNQIIILGNVAQDVDVRKTSNGKSVVRFSVAVNEYSKDGNNKTTYVDCQAWEKTADIIGQFVSKGSKVLVEGKWNSSTYEDRNGNKKKDVVCLVNKIEFFDKKSDKPKDEFVEKEQTQMEFAENTSYQGYADIKSDDLPFY